MEDILYKTRTFYILLKCLSLGHLGPWIKVFFTVTIMVIFSTVGLNDYFGAFVQMVNILSIFGLSKNYM